jgi:hypothetical protein
MQSLTGNCKVISADADLDSFNFSLNSIDNIISDLFVSTVKSDEKTLMSPSEFFATSSIQVEKSDSPTTESNKRKKINFISDTIFSHEDDIEKYGKRTKRDIEESTRQRIIRYNLKALRNYLPNGEDLNTRHKVLCEEIDYLNKLIRENRRLYSKN